MHWLTGGGDHGHSHGPGSKCSGHGPAQMTEEQRAELMRQFHAHMEMAKNAMANNIAPGRVLYDPSSPDPGAYSTLIYGYGHEPMQPASGWGELAASTSGAPAPIGSPFAPVGPEELMMQMGGPAERDRFWMPRVPLLGRLRIVKDKTGLMQASVVLLYWLYGNWSTWNAILLPYYADGTFPSTMLILYATVSALCITSFVRASTLNPGSLNSVTIVDDDWTECKVCEAKRPPMSHHCRRCGQCVRKMDHHCPWINNCVGEENQFAFLLLLIYAFLLSVCTLAVVLVYFFKLEDCVTCDKDSFMVRYQTPVIWVDLALAVMMLFSSFALFMNQHIGIIHETPAVEWMKLQREWIMTGTMPKDVYKSVRPMNEIYGEVCGASSCFLLPFPCRRKKICSSFSSSSRSSTRQEA